MTGKGVKKQHTKNRKPAKLSSDLAHGERWHSQRRKNTGVVEENQPLIESIKVIKESSAVFPGEND